MFSANVYLTVLPTGYFDLSTSLNFFLHTWTLAVEEQFYLVFPLVLLALWWVAGCARRSVWRASVIAAVLLPLAALSLTLAVSLGGKGAFYLAPARAWEFLVGVLVALVAPFVMRGQWVATRRILSLSGLAGIVVAGFWALDGGRFPVVAVLPVLSTGLILAVGTGRQLGASRLLSDRRLVWVGDLSYSLYLWHWPLIVFARAAFPGTGWAAPVAAVVSVGPAWASLRLIENPIRYGPRFRSRRVFALAALCVAVPLVACTAAIGTSSRIDDFAAMKSWKVSQRLHADVVNHCDSPIPLSLRDQTNCVSHTRNATGTIVLFGDSNAGQFTEPVAAAGNQAGYDVEVVTYSSCPFVGVRVRWTDRREDPDCQAFSAQTTFDLVKRRPSLVIVAARTDWYVDDPRASLAATSRNQFTNDLIEKQTLWRAALTQTLQRLNGAGIPVILIHPIPQLPDAPDGCSVIRILLGACSTARDRATEQANLAPSTELEQRAIAHIPRVFCAAQPHHLERRHTRQHGLLHDDGGGVGESRDDAEHDSDSGGMKFRTGSWRSRSRRTRRRRRRNLRRAGAGSLHGGRCRRGRRSGSARC